MLNAATSAASVSAAHRLTVLIPLLPLPLDRPAMFERAARVLAGLFVACKVVAGDGLVKGVARAEYVAREVVGNGAATGTDVEVGAVVVEGAVVVGGGLWAAVVVVGGVGCRVVVVVGAIVVVVGRVGGDVVVVGCRPSATVETRNRSTISAGYRLASGRSPAGSEVRLAGARSC